MAGAIQAITSNLHHSIMLSKRLSPAESGRSGRQAVRALSLVAFHWRGSVAGVWRATAPHALAKLREKKLEEREKKIEKVWRFVLMSNVVQANMLPTHRNARAIDCTAPFCRVDVWRRRQQRYAEVNSRFAPLQIALRAQLLGPRTIRKTGTDYGSPIQITRLPSNRSRP